MLLYLYGRYLIAILNTVKNLKPFKHWNKKNQHLLYSSPSNPYENAKVNIGPGNQNINEKNQA